MVFDENIKYGKKLEKYLRQNFKFINMIFDLKNIDNEFNNFIKNMVALRYL